MRNKATSAQMDGSLPPPKIFSDSFSTYSTSISQMVTTQDSCIGASRSQQPSPRNPFKPKDRSNQISIIDRAEQASINVECGGLGNMNTQQLNFFAQTLNSQKNDNGLDGTYNESNSIFSSQPILNMQNKQMQSLANKQNAPFIYNRDRGNQFLNVAQPSKNEKTDMLSVSLMNSSTT